MPTACEQHGDNAKPTSSPQREPVLEHAEGEEVLHRLLIVNRLIGIDLEAPRSQCAQQRRGGWVAARCPDGERHLPHRSLRFGKKHFWKRVPDEARMPHVCDDADDFGGTCRVALDEESLPKCAVWKPSGAPSVSFTMTALGASVASVAEKSLPRRIGTRKAAKYPGVITRQSTSGRSPNCVGCLSDHVEARSLIAAAERYDVRGAGGRDAG